MTPVRHSSFRGRIGLARADITPPVGIYARNWGAARKDVATGIHRPLQLTVMTLHSTDDTPPLVLVDADLGWWRPLTVFSTFQSGLLKELQLPAENLLFCLTHTHAAAPLMEADEDLAGSELIPPWLDAIHEATVRTTREAIDNTFDAVLDWHHGRCHLAANRDLLDPESTDPAGSQRTVCGYNPHESADDTLLVGRITDTTGTVRGTIANYACHPTTLAWDNSTISPDYIGAMRETVERELGGLSIFLQGASGELAPRYQYVGDPAVADRHGRQLGHAVLATVFDMQPPATELAYDRTVESGAPLAVWSPREVEVSAALAARKTSAVLELKDWPTASQLERQMNETPDRAKQERLRRKLHIRRALGDQPEFPVPVYGWRVGDAVIVGSCCEAYSVLQQNLRKQYSDRSVACLNLVNGSIGYLPPADLYSHDVYPVWQTPFARGGLEQIERAMTGLIDELCAE